MVVDKTKLNDQLIFMQNIINNRGTCYNLDVDSVSTAYNGLNIVKLEPISEETGVYSIQDKSNTEIEAGIDYSVLMNYFPYDDEPTLFKHTIVLKDDSQYKISDFNFVNGSTPIYYNDGVNIFVEEQNVSQLNIIPLTMIKGSIDYLNWNSVKSESNSTGSVTYELKNGMPNHLYLWFEKYRKSVNPPCY